MITMIILKSRYGGRHHRIVNGYQNSEYYLMIRKFGSYGGGGSAA
jgi:hypothetical protein